MVGEVREYDELAAIYEKLDTVRITKLPRSPRHALSAEYEKHGG